MYSQVGRSWGFPGQGTEAKTARHRSAGNAQSARCFGPSAEHAAGTLAGHKHQAKEFLTLKKLGNRKLLEVSRRNISARGVHWWLG